MKIVGLMMIRNEDWILNYSLPIALEWVDSLVVLDHLSTDTTAAILDQAEIDYLGRIRRLASSARDFPEMNLRQWTLDVGREIGGTHFAVIDGDEAITANLKGEIRDMFAALKPLQTLNLKMVPAWHDPGTYRVDNCVWTRATINIGWHDTQQAAWTATNGYHLHSRMPFKVKKSYEPKIDGGVVHFQFADHERLKWKHRWYKLHEAVVYPDRDLAVIDKNYDQALDEKGLKLKLMPQEWQWGTEDDIKIGRPSWHQEACSELYQRADEMGRSKLNLWGWP